MQYTSPILIESDQNTTAVMTNILQDEGYTVVSSYNYTTTHASIFEQMPALVLLDTWQRNITPIGLHAVMQNYHQADAPVVLTTPVPIIADSQLSVSSQPYLLKLFSIDALLACATTYIDLPHSNARCN
jgi:DNA-binding NtrC family response regulator